MQENDIKEVQQQIQVLKFQRRKPCLEEDKQSSKETNTWQAYTELKSTLQEDFKNGACCFEYLNDNNVPNTWNASHLKFYFN